MQNEYMLENGLTLAELKRRREIAEAMMGANVGSPSNVGEGLTALGKGIAGIIAANRAKKAEKAFIEDPRFAAMMQRGGGDFASIFGPPLGQMPAYQNGTMFHPGGQAIVGERGPEVVNMPPGAQVLPFTDPALVQMFQSLQPDEQAQVLDRVKQGYTPDEAFAPDGYSPQGLIAPDQVSGGRVVSPEAIAQAENPYAVPVPRGIGQIGGANAFVPGAETMVAQAGPSPITPSGVGEQSMINNGAYAYQSVLNEFDAYSKMLEEDVPVLPGPQLDAVRATRRNIQMQLKELYNLGVLNGPDLELMDQIMFDPTSIGARVVDLLGISDKEDRAISNVEQVKRMLENLIGPKLSASGIDIEMLKPGGQGTRDITPPDGGADQDGWQEINGVRIRVKQ